MRILFDLIGEFGGGMERQVADLAGELVRRGHAVAMVINKAASEDYRDLVSASGVDLTVLGRMGRFDAGVLGDIMRSIRRFSPDVVVAENFNATLWGRSAAVLTGRGVVVAEHSSDVAMPPVVRATNLVLGPFTHAVVACAEGQRASLTAWGHPAGKIAVVHNAVDSEHFGPDPAGAAAFRRELGIGEDAFVVGMVAAHRPEKRHDRLVTLAERLREGGVPAVVCAVGSGPLFERTEALVEASAARDTIRLVPRRSDIVPVYSACDAVVLVSDSVETFPLSFLEAQACETPVVGMRVGGVGESFVDGETGFLVDQGDIGAMAEALRRLRDDPALRERMGAAGRRLVTERFTLAGMADAYEDILAAAAEKAGRPRRRRP